MTSLPDTSRSPLRLPGIDGGVDARPFIKWAGGKTRLLSSILTYVPHEFGRYHEPFLGGGAMFFAVGKRATAGRNLADLNHELITTWKAVQEQPTELLGALREYTEKDSETFYYEVRHQKPVEAIPLAAWFVYLNQTAWNGLWRVNKHGQFNVPHGKRPFRGLKRENLNAVSESLSQTTISQVDFRVVLSQVSPGDFVYLDPPYLPTSDTSKFCFYTEKRFRLPDLRDLASICAELTDHGVTWILSNRDTDEVRELFGSATIVGLTTHRSVAAQNNRNVEPVKSPEVIVVGGAS